VADDDLVDVGLRELLRLDLVLLRRAEQIVEERDVELQDLDELEDAAVGDVELAVEVEGARVRVRAVLRDLAVVDVARELGRVLVLLVLRLERARNE
jgi:rRNA maturation endonuclease Nob1